MNKTTAAPAGMPVIFNPKSKALDFFRGLERQGLSLFHSKRSGFRVVARNQQVSQ